MSETEVRVRRAKVITDDDLPFAEVSREPLSDRDRDKFLKFLADPPAPSSAIKRAAARQKARRD